MLAIFGSAEVALAVDTNAFSASVSVLSPDPTGFIIGGQSSVNGVGSSSVVMTRTAAELAVTGGANSQLVGSSTPGILSGVQSDSFINSALNFSRKIDTAGSLVGQGSVVATGQAIGSIGTAGAASASTEASGVSSNAANTGSGAASADSSSQGSLNGSVSTSNTLQLLGTNGLFAGSNSLSVGEKNLANAYGKSTILSDGETGISLAGAALVPDGSLGMMQGSNDGALFDVTSSLTSVTAPSGTLTGIALSVANAGNGTISLTTSTGGFFTGGGFANGGADFSDTGAFFGAP
jgi:hypothetical protein